MIHGADKGGSITPTNGVPQVIVQADGPSSYMAGVHATVYGVPVGGKVYYLTADGKPFVWDWDTRTLTAGNQIGGATASNIGGLFVTASGAIIVSCTPSGATYARIYRSTDGLTYTQVADFNGWLTPLSTTDNFKMVTQAGNGWLFASVYGTDAAGSNAGSLLRSKDDGLTWEDIQLNLNNPIKRHMHFVQWDRYRSLLFAGGGDDGGGVDESLVEVSADYGDTWTVLPQTFQCTGIIAHPTHLFLCSDRQSAGSTQETNIWRITGATLAELVASPIAVAFNSVSGVPFSFSGPGGAGFAWGGVYDAEHGVLYASYGSGTAGTGDDGKYGYLVASEDDGATWHVVGAVTGAGTGYQWGEPSFVDNDRAGWKYSSLAVPRALRWMVVRSDYVAHINQATGKHYNTGTIAAPLADVLESAGAVKSNALTGKYNPIRHKLVADYAINRAFGRARLVLDKGAFNFTGSVTGTLDTNEGFEHGTDTAPSGWAETVLGGDVVWNSATQKRSGSYSARCETTVATSGQYAHANRTISSIASMPGETLWIDFGYYLDEASSPGNLDICRLPGGTSLRLFASTGYLIFVSTTPATSCYPCLVEPKAFTLRQWVKIKIAYRISSAQNAFDGRVRVWQDGQLILDVSGVITNNGSQLTSIYFGHRNQSSHARISYVDDVRTDWGADIDQPSGVVFNATACVQIPDGRYS